jgi:hypothetical protein
LQGHYGRILFQQSKININKVDWVLSIGKIENKIVRGSGDE